MRARRTFAAALTASVLLLSAACGSKDDNSEESTGSPEVTASAEATEEPSEEPSEEPTASASPSASADAAESGKVVESMDGKTVTLSLELVDGKPKVRPPVKVEVKKGQTFVLLVTSDEAHEIHVHTYDESIDLKPDKEGKISFVADTTGSFEVEVEDTKFKLFDLQVK